MSDKMRFADFFGWVKGASEIPSDEFDGRADALTVSNGWFDFGGDGKLDSRLKSLDKGVSEAERKLERLVELDDEIGRKCKSIDAGVRGLVDETLELSRRAEVSLDKLAELRERYGSSSDTMPPLDSGALKARAAKDVCQHYAKFGDQASKDACEALMRELKA